MTKLDSAAQAILLALLVDFRARGLGADDLREGYEGFSLAAVMGAHVGSGTSQVDFDLAMKELETGKLVRTGPMVPYENDPNSDVFILALFSKREFINLTEKGYRAAQQIRSPSQQVPRASVHISGGTFHQSPIGVGTQVTQSVNVNIDNPTEVVAYLLDLAERGGLKVDDAVRAEVKHLVQVTGTGDLAGAKPLFQRLFGEAADGVKQVAWGVVSAIAAKFLGI